MMDGFWIDESPDAIVVCDKEGKLLVLNEKAAKIFEASGGKALLGKSMFDCHPESIQPKIKALLANPRTITYTDELNNPVLKYRGYDCDWKSRLRLKPFKKCGLEVLLKT